jgi:hypothetical protein
MTNYINVIMENLCRNSKTDAWLAMSYMQSPTFIITYLLEYLFINACLFPYQDCYHLERPISARGLFPLWNHGQISGQNSDNTISSIFINRPMNDLFYNRTVIIPQISINHIHMSLVLLSSRETNIGQRALDRESISVKG